MSNNPLQKIPKGQPEIWCLFGTQIVKTLLDTGAYKSLIRPTVLDGFKRMPYWRKMMRYIPYAMPIK